MPNSVVAEDDFRPFRLLKHHPVVLPIDSQNMTPKVPVSFFIATLGLGVIVAIMSADRYPQQQQQQDRPRGTTPMRAGLRHCRWSRPHHAARLTALARS